MGRRGIPKRRYYYDKKGNLTGSSSDTYLATPKGMAGLVVMLFVIAIWHAIFGKEGSQPQEELNEVAGSEQPGAEQRTVIASSLSVRDDDRMGATKIGTLPYGTKAKVLYDGGDWARIEYSGGTGWVFDKYLGKRAPEEVAASSNSQDHERPPSKPIPSGFEDAAQQETSVQPQETERPIEVPTDGRPVQYARARSTEAYMRRTYVGGNSNCPREMVSYQLQQCRAGDEQQCRLLEKTCGVSIKEEISATAASK